MNGCMHIYRSLPWTLLDELSKEAKKTIVSFGDFNINLSNFDTSEHLSTFLMI